MPSAARPLVVVAMLALCGAAGACTGAASQSRPVNPARPTPAVALPSSIRPIRTADDAIATAEGWISGQTNTNLRAARIQSVAYVQTRLGDAAKFIGGSLPNVVALDPPATTAWLFVAQGDYAEHSRFDTTPPPLKPSTLWVLVVQGNAQIAYSGFATKALDLTQLGTPVVVPPGRVPAIDRLRAPATASPTASPRPMTSTPTAAAPAGTPPPPGATASATATGAPAPTATP